MLPFSTDVVRFGRSIKASRCESLNSHSTSSHPQTFSFAAVVLRDCPDVHDACRGKAPAGSLSGPADTPSARMTTCSCPRRQRSNNTIRTVCCSAIQARYVIKIMLTTHSILSCSREPAGTAGSVAAATAARPTACADTGATAAAPTSGSPARRCAGSTPSSFSSGTPSQKSHESEHHVSWSLGSAAPASRCTGSTHQHLLQRHACTMIRSFLKKISCSLS